MKICHKDTRRELLIPFGLNVFVAVDLYSISTSVQRNEAQ